MCSNHKDVINMKINEARKIYSSQLREYREQKNLLNKQKQELEQKSKTAGKEEQAVFAKEAAVLELSINALDEKREEYQEYMNKLTEQWAAKANMIVAEQQGEAAKEYVEDLAKIMEVARRLMKGGIVPASDERKLMEYSMELYQAAKNIGALAKEREEYDSLWEEKKEEAEVEDPMEAADNTEAFAEGPEVVSAADTVASVTQSGSNQL